MKVVTIASKERRTCVPQVLSPNQVLHTALPVLLETFASPMEPSVSAHRELIPMEVLQFVLIVQMDHTPIRLDQVSVQFVYQEHTQ